MSEHTNTPAVRHPELAIRNGGVWKLTANVFAILERRPALGTASILVSYVLGFIISNIHLAQYKLITFDLVEGRYLAAAILFFLFTPTPVFLGFALGASLHWESEEATAEVPSWRMRILGVVLTAGLLYFVVMVSQWAFEILAVPSERENIKFVYLYFALCGFVGLLLSYRGVRSKAERESDDGRGGLEILMFPMFVLLPVLVATVFSQAIYPALSPAFGGGGAWKGQVFLNEPPTTGMLADLDTVLIIDR
ncbi:MAG TPA: hypothetical protein VF647_04855, partial [Longimicrobium sp.]